MSKIPHGTTLQERLAYAGRISGHATSYYQDNSGTWILNSGDPGVRLIEVWQHPNPTQKEHVYIHPSRHEFHWVGDDPSQRKAWHALATLKRGGLLPPWATEHSIIGYTSEHAIQLPPMLGSSKYEWLVRLQEVITNTGSSWFPSVYYRDGHLTVQHKDPTNVGWKPYRWPSGFGASYPRWSLPFFGNVLEKYVV